MNAILSLCHFCEIHGPSVLFSTQSFHFAGEENCGQLEPSGIQFFGSLKKLGDYSAVVSESMNNVACEACQSTSGYVTNDYQDKISYLSTRLAIDSNVSSLLKQAAVRSLSCEVVPGKEGQIYFGDSIRGHVLSHTFFLKDAQARGFNRWYSVVVFMRDKHFLLNSWPFFQKHIKQMVVQLQNKASQVYTNEQNQRSQRSIRLSCPDHRHGTSRSLPQLTASPTVFAQLHLWFTWLLSSGAKRLEEDLPTRPLDCELHERQDEEFIIVEELKNEDTKSYTEETIANFRKLRKVLGDGKFQTLVHSTLVGHQIVIRGPKHVVKHIISLLRFILPQRKVKCLEFAETYHPPEICNIIGLELYAAVPVPSVNIIRLDIVPPEHAGSSEITNAIYEQHQFLLKCRPETPSKSPTLLLKIEKAISDDTLTDGVVLLHIISLVEQWSHTTDVIREAKKKPGNHDLTGLLQYLGVQEHDDRLVEFWTS